MKKQWKILGKIKEKTDNRQEEIVKVLLKNRGLKTKKEVENFLHPKHPSTLTLKEVGLSEKAMKKTVERIFRAAKNGEKIIIYSDYDTDGISGATILYESLKNLGIFVLPYVPRRDTEGYGLSKSGIEAILTDPYYTQGKAPTIIITVDNGIVANEAVKYANSKGFEVIITDHHEKGEKIPEAYEIIHTLRLCGAGVAWFLAREIDQKRAAHLDIVALATIADLVPLKGANRSFVKYGLEELRKTNRPGLTALIEEAGIEKEQIGTYEVGYVIAPRLNAMGRLEHGLDALRLLCTKDPQKAHDLAAKLNLTNKERQLLTEESFFHARDLLLNGRKTVEEKIIFLANETYNQGVIGLIAGRLTEEFYRPSIVISQGEIYSKASARSVHGVNIIETIRKTSDILVNCGGHPMAAGFTVETKHLEILKKRILEIGNMEIKDEQLQRILKIDCELTFENLDLPTYRKIQDLSPFGMENPEPVFFLNNAVLLNFQLVGPNGKHLKLWVDNPDGPSLEAIGFSMGERAKEVMAARKVDLAFTLDLNSWNGREKLQLKLKDIRIN